ncbi:MAG: hypothetical protein ACE5ET_01430 [Gammaproteobacteria bacterium]
MNNSSVDITTKVVFLSRPAAYPERPQRVEVIETHMSWVFLNDRHVYKLHKPVRTDYLDFSTLERRRADCEEELRLNRQLAPDIYLGLVALTRESDGGLALAGTGEVVEWLVKMRRLPRERMLDTCITQGTVTPTEVDRLTEVLVAFYRQAPPCPMSGEAYRQRWRRDVQTHHRLLLAAADRDLPVRQLEHLRDGLLGFVQDRPALLAARAARVVEAHGDLRPEHVCLREPPVFIDRLEFNRDFRLQDPAEELAFLALECEHVGAAWIGERLFATYQRLSDDRVNRELLAFYKAARAQLRARLSASHLTDHPPRGSVQKWLDKTRAYLQLAQRYLTVLG